MDKKYGIILSDPPWQQSKGGKKAVRPNSSGKPLDYKTLTLDEINVIHRYFFAQAADKHNVFMWTIDKYLHDSERMMAEAGYKLHARLIWDKVLGISSAFTVRFSHEYLLWFYKPGKILMPVDAMRGKYSTILREIRTKHSKKPEASFKMLEDMFPTVNKLELFSRLKRPGWDAWGDEL